MASFQDAELSLRPVTSVVYRCSARNSTCSTKVSSSSLVSNVPEPQASLSGSTRPMTLSRSVYTGTLKDLAAVLIACLFP